MSSYFLLLFSDTNNEVKNTITIENIKGDILELFIKYFYTGFLQIESKNVEDLLIAATNLNVTNVVNACISFISRRIYIENYLEILNFAEYHKYQILLANVEEFICRNFYEISYTNEFMSLNSKQLCKFISNDDLNVKNEEQIFHIIKYWTNKVENEPFLPGLLTMLRIPLLSNEFIDKHLKSICDAKGCHKLYTDVLMSRLLKEKNINIKQKLCTKRTPQLIGDLMALGRNSATQNWDILSYFKDTDTWIVWKMNVSKFNSIVNFCLNNDKLIISEADKVHSIKLFNRKIETIKNFQMERVCPKLVELNSFIYAIGGWNAKSNKNITSIETWHSLTNYRYFVKDIPIKMGSFEVVTIREYLYVIGGFNRETKERLELLRYDHITNTWKNLAPMFEKRLNPGVAADERYIYVVGGRFEKNVLNRVDRYDTQNNEWTKLQPLVIARFGCGCASICNELYVVGGFNSDHKELLNVEVFNKTTDKWRFNNELPGFYSWVSIVKPTLSAGD